MTPTDKRFIQISKFLSLVLRHKPEEIDTQWDAAPSNGKNEASISSYENDHWKT